MYGRILIPIDGSSCSEQAVSHGVRLAAALGSTVVFLFAMDTIPVVREGVVGSGEALQILRAQGGAIVARAIEIARAANVVAEEMLVEGLAADVIVRESDGFDLVVMGSHGKGFLQRMIVGSVTEAVLHRIARPLLVIQCNRATANAG